MKCVVFFAEGATLAHVLRPLRLALALDPSRHEVYFAVTRRYLPLLPRGSARLRYIPLRSEPTETFLENLARGRPVFDRETLDRYVEEDCAILARTDPALVVGDMRLSLAVSARMRGVVYATITNAHWSPHAAPEYPLPDIGWERALGLPLAKRAFAAVAPWGMRRHAAVHERMREGYGFPSLGRDLRRVYTDADIVLYADVPELVAVGRLPENHWYLGALAPSLDVPLPPWWRELRADVPIIYWNLGSSGPRDLLRLAAAAFDDWPVQIVAATAGGRLPCDLPRNFRVAPYLPGDVASAVASLVICNGGTGAVYAALGHGVPVLGICSNFDQYLFMSHVERAGAGVTLRAGMLDERTLAAAAARVLRQRSFTSAALAAAASIARYLPERRFEKIVEKVQVRRRADG